VRWVLGSSAARGTCGIYFQVRGINFMHNRCRFFSVSDYRSYTNRASQVVFLALQFCNMKAGTAKYERSTPRIFRWKMFSRRNLRSGIKIWLARRSTVLGLLSLEGYVLHLTRSPFVTFTRSSKGTVRSNVGSLLIDDQTTN
jgi:hypothetical protein